MSLTSRVHKVEGSLMWTIVKKKDRKSEGIMIGVWSVFLNTTSFSSGIVDPMSRTQKRRIRFRSKFTKLGAFHAWYAGLSFRVKPCADAPRYKIQITTSALPTIRAHSHARSPSRRIRCPRCSTTPMTAHNGCTSPLPQF